jgi:hypothetical protein
MSFSYWFSFVGNVLGASGQMSGGITRTTNWASCNQYIWLMGWGDFLPDSTQKQRLCRYIIRDGNWDWLNSQQKWETPLPSPFEFNVPELNLVSSGYYMALSILQPEPSTSCLRKHGLMPAARTIPESRAPNGRHYEVCRI